MSDRAQRQVEFEESGREGEWGGGLTALIIFGLKRRACNLPWKIIMITRSQSDWGLPVADAFDWLPQSREVEGRAAAAAGAVY